METLEEKVARVLKDRIELVPYNPVWPSRFEAEKQHLTECLPDDLLVRIEHYGSTSIPGMTAKPVVDMLVEVTNLERAREQVPPTLEAQGYDYFWKSTDGDGQPPFYVWLIKRDETGQRTHHIHMIDAKSRLWEGLVFRDYLIAHPDVAEQYLQLKQRLAREHSDDRIAYTHGKGAFIRDVLARAS